jgi:alanine racemase
MAVVKADGFGHGMVDVARAALAGGATRLGTTSLAEALALRAAGLAAPVLSWLNPVDADFRHAVAHGVELAVPSLTHLWSVIAREREHRSEGRARSGPAGPHSGIDQTVGARIHLQLDTGLARDGAPPGEWEELCHRASQAEQTGSVRVVGVMGHLACAAQPDHPANAEGRARFDWAVRIARAAGLRPPQRHLAATAATCSDPRTHNTMSRIGAGLVGIDESGTVSLRPALRLVAPLVQVRDVGPGTPVGYGHTWAAPRATRLGLIPVGYADGLPRLAGDRAWVQVAGVRRPGRDRRRSYPC